MLLYTFSHGTPLHQKDTSKLPKIQWDELDPRAVGFVKDYLEIHEARLTNMKVWGQPYFFMIESVLNRYHLPPSLKYLAVIESDLKGTALSSAGAVGPWQFMAGTAKDLGLIVTATRDDRMDLYKSTHAAAKFLSRLYEQLGDWLLVVAAYNGGPARVENIIAANKSRDFWMIQHQLPAESRNHVKKFIATHYIFERNGSETTGMKNLMKKYRYSQQKNLPQLIPSVLLAGFRARSSPKILPLTLSSSTNGTRILIQKYQPKCIRSGCPKKKSMYSTKNETRLHRNPSC